MTSAILVKFFSWILSVFLTIGAMFAAANTMFAAVAGRSREIGTLRAMGFRRGPILLSFLLESVLICLLGDCSAVCLRSPLTAYRPAQPTGRPSAKSHSPSASAPPCCCEAF